MVTLDGPGKDAEKMLKALQGSLQDAVHRAALGVPMEPNLALHLVDASGRLVDIIETYAAREEFASRLFEMVQHLIQSQAKELRILAARHGDHKACEHAQEIQDCVEALHRKIREFEETKFDGIIRL